MGDELTIYAKILATLSGQGFTQAEAGLGKTEKAAKGAARSLVDAESAGKQLGRTLQRYLGAAVLGALVRSSVTAFAQYERGLMAIRKQLEALGLDAGKAIPQIDAFLRSIEAAGNGLRQDTLPVFQKFLGITKSVPGAMAAVNLAADITEAGLGDLASNADGLAQLLQGRATAAATSFGLELRDASGHVKTNAELLTELMKLYGGFAQTTNDTTDAIDKGAASWNEFKSQLGELLAGPASAFLGWTTNVVKGLRLLPIEAQLAAIKIKSAFVGMSDEAQLEFDSLVKKGQEIFQSGTQTDTAKGSPKSLLDVASGKDKEAADEEREERAKKEAKAQEEMLEKVKERAEERAAIEAEAHEQRLRVELAAAKEGSQKELILREVLLDLQKQAALKAAEEVGASTLEIEAAFAQEKVNLQAEFDAARLEKEQENAEARAELERNALLALLDEEIASLEEHDARKLELLLFRLEQEMAAELAAENLTEEAKAKIRAKYRKQEERLTKAAAKAEVDVDKQAKLLKLEIAQLYAAATFAVMGEIFGANKALAIAEALIFTFLGAAKALAENPPPSPIGIASAAFVIATGLARVNQIRKTDFSKNKGFDVPAHDRLAYMGGRRWAEDMVRNVDLGFRDGFAAPAQRSDPGVLAGGSQTSNTYNQTLNFGHVLGGRAEARRISRILDRARARDAGRTVR